MLKQGSNRYAPAAVRIRRSKAAIQADLEEAEETIDHQRHTIGTLTIERDGAKALLHHVNKVQTASQAAMIGRQQILIETLEGERDMWRDHFFRVAAGSPAPRLTLVRPEGA